MKQGYFSIVFMGTPDFCIPTLTALQKAENIKIKAVVSQPDKEIGRRKTITAPPVKLKAQELGLKVLQPHNALELSEALEGMEIDFLVVLSYGMILKNKTLQLPRIAPINIHTSILPKYRGASPIHQAILNGDQETGVSIMKMSEKMDEGDVYQIEKVIIDDQDNIKSLSKKLSNKSAEIIVNSLEKIASAEIKPQPQDHNQATYCRKIEKNDGLIDWSKNSKQILNMHRAFLEWPQIFTRINDKKLKILELKITDKSIPPGEIILEDRELIIGTGDKAIKISRLQLEGKNAMNTKDFLNGYGHSLPPRVD